MNKCKLCGAHIADPIAEVGSNIPYDIQIMTNLATHISTAHKRTDEHLQLAAMSYLGVSRLSHFELSDPKLRAHVDKARWMMAQLLQQVPSRSEVDRLVSEMLRKADRQDTPDNRKICREFVQSILDRCFETGKYSEADEPAKVN